MAARYKHLFGPVPSRRLGMSLGVDLIPHKICSLNCVYCECGRSTNLTSERSQYVPVDDMFKELTNFFESNPDPEYITFSGAGEPTLHSHIGEVLAFIKTLRPKIPVAVLSNGSLFNDPDVRKDLMQADLVLPSLDAVTDKAFRKINRPVGNITIEDYVQGLIDFSHEFTGEIWMEVLILPGYNDTTPDILALKEALLKISPQRIQLNTLDRPGAVKGLEAASTAELERIAGLWNLDNVEIIAPPQDPQEVQSFRTDVKGAILETLSRRPCTLKDLEKILGLPVVEITEILRTLTESGDIETNIQERGTFYQLTQSQ